MARKDHFARGYFCAVGAALREEGTSTLVRSLFAQGGDPSKADAADIALFVEHGLMTLTEADSRQQGGAA